MALRNPNGSEKKKELIATRKGRTTSLARDIRGLDAVLCASYALINRRGDDTARGVSRDPSRVIRFSDRFRYLIAPGARRVERLASVWRRNSLLSTRSRLFRERFRRRRGVLRRQKRIYDLSFVENPVLRST